MTSAESAQANSTTCLMQPATTFFDPQMKKNLSKTTTTKLYPVKKWKAVHKK